MPSKKKKNKKNPKFGKNSNIVFHMTSEEATLANKPHYNGFAGGHGIHGDTKYNRNKTKSEFRRELDDN